MGKGEVSTEQETQEVQLTDLLLDITAPPMEPDDIRIYYLFFTRSGYLSRRSL
jgi:hypothetical protein